MTDAQLWEFFGRRCDPSPEPNDEWNARAKAAILSDDLPANASSEMTAVDAARYICRLLRVLQEVAGMLSPRDPTAGTVFLRGNQVRAAFVRGIALRGGDPMEASLLFTRGMEEAELRELVEFDLISPGREDCLVLTGTGRVLAEVVVASDRGQGVQGTITKLQQAALDGDFSEWVRNAVRRFAADYDPLDATIHREVIRQYQNLYEDFVAKHFPTDDGPNWVNGSKAEIELAMREDFENTEKFRLATIWSKDGSRCLSCGRDWNDKWIDLSTLSSSAQLTLVALYLMSIGDSVLLAASPPDWEAWRSSDNPMETNIAWLVSDYPDPSDTRFERMEIVANRVLAEWEKTLSSRPQHSPDIGKYKWTPCLLEGYVIAMLKEKASEDLTEREAVKWIADRSRWPEPSRSTLRKTFSWQKKRRKPRTTNEAQSGVSPAQNADATVPHDEVIDTVIDIADTLHRELVDAEREAVAWTLQQAGANEEERAEAISQLIVGFRNAGI